MSKMRTIKGKRHGAASVLTRPARMNLKLINDPRQNGQTRRFTHWREVRQSRFLLPALIIAAMVQIIGDITLAPKTFDSVEYLALSESLFHNRGYSASAGLNGFHHFIGESPTRMRQPGYPVFLVLTYWALGRSTLVVRIIQLVMLLGSLCLVESIAAISLRDSHWPISILIVACYFPWLWTSCLILSESLFIFLLSMSVYFIARALFTPQRLKSSLLAGMTLGLLALVRPIGLIVSCFSLIPFLVRYGLKGGVRSWSVCAAATVLVLTPWSIRNLRSFGELTPISSESGYNLWASSLQKNEPVWFDNPQFQEATRGAYYIDRNASERFQRLAWRNFSKSPISLMKQGIARSVSAWFRFPGSGNFSDTMAARVLALIQGAVVTCAIVGLWNVPRVALWLLLTPILAIIVMQPLTPPVTRYLLPVAPYYLILAGNGIRRLVRYFPLRGQRNRGKGV